MKGVIIEKGLTYIILVVNSIGYKVFVTPEILEKQVGDEVAVYTYHKVAEDGQALFGVPDFVTLQFFELLITVSGVGPKVALAILSSASVDSVKQAIAGQDAAIFKQISGVGSKIAERIIVDLKSKVGAVHAAPGLRASSDVFDALISLGYNQREVREVINKIDLLLPQQEQIRQALKFLGGT
jgi:holliday junction DNA helicase RuvA